MNDLFASHPRAKKPARRPSGALILLLVILPLLCAWVWMLVPQWQAVGKRMQEIPFSLHAAHPADYSVGSQKTFIPAVKISILRDVLRDREPDAQDVDARVAVVVDQLRTPVPTATVLGNPPTPQHTQAASATAAKSQTSAPTLKPTPMITPTVPISSPTSAPPVPTYAAPLPTQTPDDPSTPRPTRTKSSTPTITSTATGTHTPTPTTTVTPTATSTETATPTITATETATPIATATETPTPTSTEIATGTPTQMPTETPTETATVPDCLPSDSTNGYILAVIPANDSTDVSVDMQPVILFNQAMNRASLTYGNNRHIQMGICLDDTCATNINIGASLSISSITYLNDQVTIQPDFQLVPGVIYQITIGNQIQNQAACGSQNQGVRVYRTFTTAP